LRYVAKVSGHAAVEDDVAIHLREGWHHQHVEGKDEEEAVR
jgi:hypothetical protein